MGQYYYPINLSTFEWLKSHDYDNGLKLMEHSYLNNSFVGVIMKLLTKGEKWYKTKIVWCGDYSEKVYGDNNLYDMCSDKDDKKIKLFNKINPTETLEENKERNCLLVNHTKKEYVKFSELKPSEDEWIINPLPLLTALGDGNGGGDYRGCDMDLIGSWAFDEISVEFDEDEFKEYVKINANFKEGEEENNSEENEQRAYEEIKKWLDEDKVKKLLFVRSL